MHELRSPGKEISRKRKRAHQSKKEKCVTTPETAEEEERAPLDDLEVEIFPNLAQEMVVTLGEG